MQQGLQKQLGLRIRELRKRRKWSQEAFADLCELDRTYVGSVERGERNVTLNSLQDSVEDARGNAIGTVQGTRCLTVNRRTGARPSREADGDRPSHPAR